VRRILPARSIACHCHCQSSPPPPHCIYSS
jgi:hypothetical protein